MRITTQTQCHKTLSRDYAGTGPPVPPGYSLLVTRHSSAASRQPPATRPGSARARVWRFRLFGLKGNSSCSFDPAASRFQFRLSPIRPQPHIPELQCLRRICTCDMICTCVMICRDRLKPVPATSWIRLALKSRAASHKVIRAVWRSVCVYCDCV